MIPDEKSKLRFIKLVQVPAFQSWKFLILLIGWFFLFTFVGDHLFLFLSVYFAQFQLLLTQVLSLDELNIWQIELAFFQVFLIIYIEIFFYSLLWNWWIQRQILCFFLWSFWLRLLRFIVINFSGLFFPKNFWDSRLFAPLTEHIPDVLYHWGIGKVWDFLFNLPHCLNIIPERYLFSSLLFFWLCLMLTFFIFLSFQQEYFLNFFNAGLEIPLLLNGR